MTRRLLPLVGIAALSAALGCAELREPLILGEAISDAPTSPPWLGAPPTSKGGGPSDKCHDPDLDLDDPAEAPDGFEEGDDSEFSPAHPPHLKDKKKRGIEENI